MADQVKVTVSFTTTVYNAALLMTLYELLSTEPADVDNLSPQTVDNYATLLDEVTDSYRQKELIRIAGGISDVLQDEIKRVIASSKQR